VRAPHDLIGLLETGAKLSQAPGGAQPGSSAACRRRGLGSASGRLPATEQIGVLRAMRPHPTRAIVVSWSDHRCSTVWSSEFVAHAEAKPKP